MSRARDRWACQRCPAVVLERVPAVVPPKGWMRVVLLRTNEPALHQLLCTRCADQLVRALTIGEGER